VGLLLVAQSLLAWLTLSYEATQAQDRVDSLASELAAHSRQLSQRRLQDLQPLLWEQTPDAWKSQAMHLLQASPVLQRLEWRGPEFQVLRAQDSPFSAPLFRQIPREDLDVETELACTAAVRQGLPLYSRSYFAPVSSGEGLELIDLCLPRQQGARLEGYLVLSLSLHHMLDEVLTTDQARQHELSFVEGDGTRLARAGLVRGAGHFRAQRVLDLPGQTLLLRVDSAAGRPALIPNLAVALVLGLSLALFAVVLLLARDGRRRAKAEHDLAEALAFRKAMENSLITGLRARDMDGRVSYVNPAFCQMVGFSAEEILSTGGEPEQSAPPYWPPEHVDTYRQRHRDREARWRNETATGQDPRQGFETVFMRSSGERFPVMVFEAPLLNAQGQQTGWMSATVDISEQRRVEELSRQQQDRLQAAARLATIGEMASLLSHELNQPLAAIASYATGSLNLIEREGDDPQTLGLVRQAVGRIAEQAERAGRVIKSVHDVVRRREQAYEVLSVEQLFDAVLPLVRLQARKSGTRIELDLKTPPPRVRCDRTMVEQVLLNLTRNAIQAMETATPLADRVLRLRARQQGRWVMISVADCGPGIPAEVGEQLFTPFFTTRSEGMGLGLSLCRTVVEQHGGQMDYESRSAAQPGQPSGTEFRFTLPAFEAGAGRAGLHR